VCEHLPGFFLKGEKKLKKLALRAEVREGGKKLEKALRV
jgi:hypothetical protein